MTSGVSTAASLPDAHILRRARSIRLASGANLLAKLVTIFTSFATVPLTLHYLGAERFGLWMTISSLTAFLAFADFGLGNGLLNAVSRAFGEDDRVKMRQLIGNGLALLSGLAVVTLLTLLPLALFGGLNWAEILGLHDPLAIAEAPAALAAFTFCFAASMPGGIVQRAQLALQMGFMNAVANGCGAVLGLAAVFVVIQYQGGLPWLVAALMGAPAATTLLSGIWFFRRSQPDLMPRLPDLRIKEMRSLFEVGGLFFLLQVTGAITYGSDNLIGAKFAGAAAVGEFSVASKLFTGLTLVVGIYLTSLWPAYAEAISRGQMQWVRKTLHRSIVLIGGFTLVGSLLVVFGFDMLMAVWIRQPVTPSVSMLWGLLAWTVLGSVGNAIAIFLNGAHVVREQLYIAVIFAVVCLPLKAMLTSSFGMTAIPWVTATVYLGTTLLPYLLLLPGLLKRLERQHAS